MGFLAHFCRREETADILPPFSLAKCIDDGISGVSEAAGMERTHISRNIHIFDNPKLITAFMEIIRETRDAYQTPSLRIIATNLETSFLASNLEPIDGGEGPDIDW